MAVHIAQTALAAPLGVSVPTIASWLAVLEATAQIFLVPPYFENAGKRLVKSPKLYLADSGLACHLLGLRSTAELERSPFFGPVLEGHVAAELLKLQANHGERRELYTFRDQQGLEVDFVRPRAGAGLELVEVKATRTPVPSMAASLTRLRDALLRANPGREILATLVHRSPKTPAGTTALVPAVRALSIEAFAGAAEPGARQGRPRS